VQALRHTAWQLLQALLNVRMVCCVVLTGECIFILQVKSEVEGGISFLLRNRQRDPYNHFLPRALYEAASGGKQAPTFPLA
jgi:hypothetical protein